MTSDDLERELVRLTGGVAALRMLLEDRRRTEMTPKLAGLKHALAQLHHDVEVETETTVNMIEGARAKTKTVFADTRSKIGDAFKSVESQVAEVHEFLNGLAGDNGGPPLESSSDVSGEQSPRSSDIAEQRR